MSVAERVAEVRQRIAAAAARAGRDPGEVTLVAASKTRSAEEVAAAAEAGIVEFGENYVQEAAPKRAALEALGVSAYWRMIGHLQRNKAAQAVEVFDVVDSLDSPRLGRALQARAEQGVTAAVEVLLQIRLGGEPSKWGVEPSGADELLKMVQQMPLLRCLGLMTMPPPSSVAETRRYFVELRELAEGLRERSGLPLPVLSMGMSQDYDVAVEEGATHVRIGTALFGPRT
jgi:hypothetical protein